MIRRIFLASLVLFFIAFVINGTTNAQGSRVRYWIECDSNGEARIFVYTDSYSWPYPSINGGEVRIYASPGNAQGEGPMEAKEIQPKIVAPRKNVDYRVTIRFADGWQETVYLHYGWPSGCSPTSPVNPPPPPINYPATEAARQATQQWIDQQNAFATSQAAQAATARAQAAEAARQATEQARQFQTAEAARHAVETEAAEAARRATEQAIQILNANATATANALGTLTTQTNLTATALAQNQQNIERTAAAQALLATQSAATATAAAQTAQAQARLDATMTAQALATQARLDAAALTQTAQADANATATALANATSSNTPVGNTTPVPTLTTTATAVPPPVLPQGGAAEFLNDNAGWLVPLGVLGLVGGGGLLWYAREVRRKRLLARAKNMPPPAGGNYEILHPIGSGGQGNLFLARHRNLGNYVALKQDDSGDATQFQYEARLLANLAHPNLPRVTDFFIDGNGKRCLVMDYIQGENLEQMIQKSGALAETTALTWMRPIFDAVKYLHANRIVHRDIKPANIIITPQGNAMLVDFGIAKTMATGQLTRTGARGMGTAGYAPPEQYSGGTREQSDIYALGATLYYMLTGQVPVESTHRAAGTDLIPPRHINPNITPRTEYAIMTAMNLAMNQRFASVAAMEQGLY